MWHHVSQLYHHDAEGIKLRMVPKLKYEHISLTTFSRMHIDLAAQVRLHTAHSDLLLNCDISGAKRNCVQLTGGEEANETA